MSPSRSLRGRFEHWLNDRPDDTVLRGIFIAMVIATIGVAGLDYSDLASRPAPRRSTAGTVPGVTGVPLPPVRRAKRGDGAPAAKPDDRLRAPMTFDLLADGRLMAVGTIGIGTADLFAAEIAKRGSYVKTVVLHSPGGSVRDALDMGRLIREKALATEVEGERYCASSCPLVFAGGAERRAADNASIGVHQVTVIAAKPMTDDASVENAQRISALCQKYLRDMGVDLEVWVHAMETPANELYYFKPDELLTLKLATQRNGAGKDAAASRPGRAL
jgi:hypothetical protein